MLLKCSSVSLFKEERKQDFRGCALSRLTQPSYFVLHWGALTWNIGRFFLCCSDLHNIEADLI